MSLLLVFSALATLILAAPTQEMSLLSRDDAAGANPRGISYNDAKLAALFHVAGSKMSWAYNWDSTNGGLGDLGYEFVPMLHSDHADHTNVWLANVDAQTKGATGTTHVLAFNEPDMCEPDKGGACMSMNQSIAGWRSWMEPLKKYGNKIQLGSPAVTNNDKDRNGLVYLKTFLDTCTGCRGKFFIDFVNIHWYDDATNIDYFKLHVTDALKVAGNRPVWITEMGANGSEDQIITFLKAVLPWLDSQPGIARYSMFMAKPALLITPDGKNLSAFGKVYNTL